MATRKKTAKKAAKKTSARKTSKKAAPKKAAASNVKRIPGSATVRTKSQITNSIVDATGMTRKEINTVFEALESLTVADLKKGTDVKFMGMKLTVKKKPATKARKGINPFTGEEMMFKAKPASKAVKVRALKTLNDKIGSTRGGIPSARSHQLFLKPVALLRPVIILALELLLAPFLLGFFR